MYNAVSNREKFMYSFAGLGQSMVYTLSSTFLMPFFTDVMAINSAVVGLVFLITRFWDAVNDPIMGMIVDKTKTRFGKMRPYILWGFLPIFILTSLSFFYPTNLEGNSLVVYAVVIYVLWGMFYTLADIPYNGLLCAISSDTKERAKLLSITKIMSAIGTGIPILIVPLMLQLFKDTRTGYFYTAIIISVVGAALLTLAFFGTKERFQNTEKTSLKQILKAFKNNKPLLILIFSGIFNALRFLPQSAGIYFATYNLGSSKYFSMLGGIIILASLAGIAITPLLLKGFSKKDLYIYSSLFGGVMGLVMYFMDYHNLLITCIMLFFACVPIGMFSLLFPAMVADTVDYAEWKSGQRTEGISFACSSFVSKMNAGIASFITGIVLSSFGFVENSIQTEGVLDAIYMMVTIFPAIGSILCVLPMLMYSFTESQQQKAVEQIKLRKKNGE